MLRYIPMLKLDKANDGQGGGGGTPPANPESKEQPNPEEGGAPAEAQGDNVDDLGYGPQEPETKEPQEKSGPDKKEDPAKESEKVEDPASGYGDEPKVEDPPAQEPEKKDPPAEADDMDKAIGEGLGKEESAKIKEFATKHKMSTDQVKAYADLRRQELKAAEKYAADQEKEYKNAQIRKRAEWYNELKSDKDFGGENFDKSKLMVEKVLAEHMPSTKKMLTEHKGMLPPWIMRDLLKIGKTLYATEKLVNGDPKTPKVESNEKENDFLGELYS